MIKGSDGADSSYSHQLSNQQDPLNRSLSLPSASLHTITGGSCHKFHFCRDKHVFAATKHIFCRDKSMFIATFCCDKLTFVATKHVFCRDKSTGGSCHKFHFCRDKHVFAATKMKLVAAPANDIEPLFITPLRIAAYILHVGYCERRN